MIIKHLLAISAAAFFAFTPSTTATAQSVKLLFAGDFMQHDAQIEAAYVAETDSYDYSHCFELIAPLVHEVDVAICNFEVSLGGKPYKGYPCFSAPDAFADAIKNAGFSVFLTANNHCIDKGKKGLERTIEQLKARGVEQLGTYLDHADRDARYPLIISAKGVRIALLNFTYGTNGIVPTSPNVVNYIDTAEIAQDIAKAKSFAPDFIIANVHWGVEYAQTPNSSQRSLATWLIDKGVDHVIGSHPHVVQPIEFQEDTKGGKHLVVFSLGNVISNMTRDHSDGGILVGLELHKGDKNRFEVWQKPYHVARPADCPVPNYIVVPNGATQVPECEADKLKISVANTLKILSQGDAVAEKKF